MPEQNQKPAQEQPENTPKPKTKNKKKIMIFILKGIFLLIGIAAAFGIYKIIKSINEEGVNPPPFNELACRYNNRRYEPDESFDSTDGCNTCSCIDGKAVCTEDTCNTSETTFTTTTNLSGYPVLKLSLQEIINTKCQEVQIDNWSASFISYTDFPFQLSSNSKISLPTPKSSEKEGACITGEYLENKGAISFNYKNENGVQNTATIHDEFSEELGHGGPPFYGEVGDVIKEGDDFIISAFIACVDTCGGTADEYTAYVRARKILKFKKGEKIYINIDITLFEQGNATFKTYLDQYQTNYEGTQVVDNIKAEDNFVNYFFADPANLDSPQKEVYEEALDFIKSIEYKD